MKDLAELLTENETLTTAAVGSAAAITLLTAERDAAVLHAEAAEASGKTALDEVATLKTERDTLAAEVAGLKVKQTDFDGKVAAEVSRLGIKPGAGVAATGGAASGSAATPKLTATEECLKARNVPFVPGEVHAVTP